MFFGTQCIAIMQITNKTWILMKFLERLAQREVTDSSEITNVLIVHGRSQTHSCNLCRFKLDI